MLKTFKNLFIESDDKKEEKVPEVEETVVPKKTSDRKMSDMRTVPSVNTVAWNRATIKPAGIREVQYEGVSKHNTINSSTLDVAGVATNKKVSTKSKNKNATRVAINGFGRIGRAFLKVALAESDIDIVAVNDLGDIHNMAYLLTYDTVYKKSDFEVTVEEKSETEKYLHIKNAKRNMSVQFISQRDPTLLPWKDLKVDVVVESTGLFTVYDKAQVHITSGAKRVVISAPAKKGEDASINGETVLMAINEEKISTCDITSNASCTTNASSPIIAILDEAIGIKKAILNTVHAYTASQGIVDGPNKKDYREGRAAAQNIVPSSTGAAIAVTKAFTQLEGKFDGVSMRVPVPAGSIADITFIANRNTTVEEINNALVTAAKSDRWQGIFDASNEELVSSDIQGSPFASIADLKMTRVVDGDLVKVLAWYDNEMGYTHTLVRHVKLVGQYIKSK
jgi:glyceraldehyde 3-phosphate dehydrogenase